MSSESAAQRFARDIDAQSADRKSRGWTSKSTERKNREYQ